jgi:hypothetical protein
VASHAARMQRRVVVEVLLIERDCDERRQQSFLVF